MTLWVRFRSGVVMCTNHSRAMPGNFFAVNTVNGFVITEFSTGAGALGSHTVVSKNLSLYTPSVVSVRSL